MSQKEVIRCMQDGLDGKIESVSIENTEDIESLVTAMNKQGYDFSIQDAEAVGELMQKKELSDDELDNVAGGLNIRRIVDASNKAIMYSLALVLNRALDPSGKKLCPDKMQKTRDSIKDNINEIGKELGL